MGCDGIWEKKSNEEAVEWVYQRINQQREQMKITNNCELDCQQIVDDLLHDNIAPDVQSSGKYNYIS